jgi:hypothetical protein
MTEADFQKYTARMRVALAERPVLKLHNQDEVNLRLWTARVFPLVTGVQLDHMKPSDVCKKARLRARVPPQVEGPEDGFSVGEKVTLSSAVGTPALRKLVQMGLATQSKHAGPYSMSLSGVALLKELAELAMERK